MEGAKWEVLAAPFLVRSASAASQDCLGATVAESVRFAREEEGMG